MSLNLSSNFLQFKIEMANGSKQGVYEFDGFRLDAAKLMLYRNGQEISLPPKTVETLVALIERPGEILSKNELMNRVWGDTAVEESNLSQYLYLLRKTLGKRADNTPFIETFRRRGYRFNGEVRVLNETPPTKTSSTSSDAAAQTTKISAASRYEVERRGNVLKLVERKEAEKPEAENVSKTGAANNSQLKQKSIGKTTMIAVAVFVVLLASLSFVWFKSADNAPIEQRHGELTILRLTNGINP